MDGKEIMVWNWDLRAREGDMDIYCLLGSNVHVERSTTDAYIHMSK